MGDDLQDNWMPDRDIVGNIGFDSEEKRKNKKKQKQLKKRKREQEPEEESTLDPQIDEDNDDVEEAQNSVNGVVPQGSENNEDAEREKKRRKREKAREQYQKRKAKELPFLPDPVSLGAGGQREWFWRRFVDIRRNKRSDMELEEFQLPGDFIVHPTDFEMERTLKNFIFFVKSVVPDWEKKLKVSKSKKIDAKVETGSPALLVITANANRATDLVRELRFIDASTKIAKLFTRHLKIEEQQEFLKANVVHMGVGTPNRIMKLVEIGALKLDRVKNIVIDCVKDAKNRTIFDIPETIQDLMLFFEKYSWEHLKNGKVKISMY